MEFISPCTYNRESKHIDGIFMTPDLYMVLGRYMHFGMCIGSDHRRLWLDMRTILLMGQELEQSRKFTVLIIVQYLGYLQL
jgi:hypothetical protein